MFYCALLYAHSSFEMIMMGKREQVDLLRFFSRSLMSVVWLFLAAPWVCLQFVIVVFPDHTLFLFLKQIKIMLHNKKKNKTKKTTTTKMLSGLHFIVES